MKRTFLRRPSPAIVVATTALFVALGGTSYAAFTLPKNSVGTKQLKNGAVTNKKLANGAVTASKVKNGSLTGAQINASTLGTVPNALRANSANTAGSATDATNATNATNAANATNATNATDATNATNATTATTATFATTAGGAPLPTTLPSGESLRGAYGLIGHATSSGERAGAAISFEIPLASAPIAHFINEGATPPPQCPGTPTNPRAAPGNLCIYESVVVNVMFQGFEDPITEATGATVQPFGAEVVALSGASGNYDDSGSWAVTAP
jgi:hypothetical protein